jgi:hypothetical protein
MKNNIAILGCLGALAFLTVTVYGDPAASGGGAGGGPTQVSPTGPSVATPPGTPHAIIAPGTAVPNEPGSPAPTPSAGPNYTPPTSSGGGTNAAGTGINP